MISLQEFFNRPEHAQAKGIVQKNNIIKRNIIAHMAIAGDSTLADLAKKLHISIPTVTKLVEELLAENIIADRGKIETSGGRRPNVYGLTNSAIYFAGIEVSRDQIVLVITDLQNNIIQSERKSDFALDDTDECLETICSTIENFLAGSGIDRTKLLGIGVCMAGRVNPKTGRSYKYFTHKEQSLSEIMEKRFGHRVLIENDTRARCYGEYVKGCTGQEKNIIYLNLGRGVAIGIIIDGKLYYGRSGFAGEFGHVIVERDGRECGCGRKGCLETYVSATGIKRTAFELMAKMSAPSKLRDIAFGDFDASMISAAAEQGDPIALEAFRFTGEMLGRALADVVTVTSPEAIFLFGGLSKAGKLIFEPTQWYMEENMLFAFKNKVKLLPSGIQGKNAAILGASALIWQEEHK